MNHIIEMKRIYTFTDPFHDRRPFFFSEFTLQFEDIIQLTIWAELKDQIDISFIRKDAIQLNQIDMAEVCLGCNLSSELIDKVLFPYSLFPDDFQGDK